MSNCCKNDAPVQLVHANQRVTLRIVLGINAAMFAFILVTAAGVWLTDSGWPDLVVAIGLVILLLRSAGLVITSALKELRNAA